MRDVEMPIGPITQNNIAIRLMLVGDALDLHMRGKNIDDNASASEMMRMRKFGRFTNSLLFGSMAKR